MRARTVEPGFWQLKTCQKLTMMSRRPLAACENEWLLACAVNKPNSNPTMAESCWLVGGAARVHYRQVHKAGTVGLKEYGASATLRGHGYAIHHDGEPPNREPRRRTSCNRLLGQALTR